MEDVAPAPGSAIKLKLKSKDGVIFEVEKAVATQMSFVKGMLEDVMEHDGMEIPIGEVDAHILAKVVEYCSFLTHLGTNQPNSEELYCWENKFLQVDKMTLFQLIRAANFLDVQPLFDLTCKATANMMRGKSAKQLRDELFA